MPELTAHPAYAQLLDLLRRRIGLDPDSVGTGNIPAALAALGVHDAPQLAERVEAMQWDPAALDLLVQRIVVHETWFFRDPAAFDVLAEAAQRIAATGRPVRVLSAPCSTGEEAISIAMALDAAGLDARQVEVVGLDISPRAIAQARRGAFGELAFRAQPAGWRDAHFEPDGRLWRLRRPASQVRFEVGNLLALPPAWAAERFDAVFCRNLLIYLDPPARRRVADRLRALVRPHDGLMFVGPSESTDAFGGLLERVAVPMSFGFWNRAAATPPPASAPHRPAGAARRAAAPARPPALPTPMPLLAAAAPRAPARPLPTQADCAGPLDLVRRLADRGDLAAACVACEALLERRPDAADAHALRGALAVAGGQTDLALVHLGRALYLEPRHRQALQDMVLLARARGDLAGGQRYADRLQRLPAERESA